MQKPDTHPGGGSKSVDWQTPHDLIDRLGPFDLDPCASLHQIRPTATRMLTEDDEAQPWEGLVFVNPPFGRAAQPFVEQFFNHGSGILLLPARVDTHQWRMVWRRADRILLLSRRLRFLRPGQKTEAAMFPSALVASGGTAVQRLLGVSDLGVMLSGWECPAWTK